VNPQAIARSFSEALKLEKYKPCGIYFSNDNPEKLDRVLAPFASSCIALVTYPLKLAQNSEEKAIIGNFDIAARTRMPADLLTFALPYAFLKKLVGFLPESFVTTHNWQTIRDRI
jgi:hypothetical protein